MVQSDLLERIESYLRLCRVSPARFGRAAVRDPRFVFDLRSGRKPRQKMLTKVAAYLADQDQMVI